MSVRVTYLCLMSFVTCHSLDTGPCAPVGLNSTQMERTMMNSFNTHYKITLEKIN